MSLVACLLAGIMYFFSCAVKHNVLVDLVYALCSINYGDNEYLNWYFYVNLVKQFGL